MNFLQALKNRKEKGPFPVIPDIKCYSPKEGDLLRGRDPAELAVLLESAGACVLSVVTESSEFHGSMDLLREICGRVHIPVLRKDFVETRQDLVQTAQAGASAILLMYSCLGKEKLEDLYAEALKLGLVPFVETHTPQELKWAGELGAELVGINNRNILNLERDDGGVQLSEALMKYRPRNAFLVVESGLMSGLDVRRAARCGADAVLVGTAILRDEDPAAMYRSMTRPCDLKICGLMNREGIRICMKSHVDLLGFVTEYPVPVPWNLSRAEAAELIKAARHPALCTFQQVEAGRKAFSGKEKSFSGKEKIFPDKEEPFSGIDNSFSEKEKAVPGKEVSFSGKESKSVSPGICIVTGGAPGKVIDLAGNLRPDFVQLHFTETAEETGQIAKALRREGIRVIRSIPADAWQRSRMFGTSSLSEIAGILREIGVDAMLLDSRDADNAAAGGGSVLTHEGILNIRQIRQSFPGQIITGGGITPANIRDVLAACRPDVIDIMTGIETSPGRKSEVLLREVTDLLEI